MPDATTAAMPPSPLAPPSTRRRQCGRGGCGWSTRTGAPVAGAIVHYLQHAAGIALCADEDTEQAIADAGVAIRTGPDGRVRCPGAAPFELIYARSGSRFGIASPDFATGDLDRSVVGARRNTIGRTLTEIAVRALDGEIGSRDELADPHLYIGGEVRLRFDDTQDVFVSWVQNDGWEVFCSIGSKATSYFTPDSLQEWDTADLDPWSQCLGTRLSSARVFGIDRTPHIVEFSFETASLWLGNGYQHEFGDGDDLLIRWDAQRPTLTAWHMMWSSTDPAP